MSSGFDLAARAQLGFGRRDARRRWHRSGMSLLCILPSQHAEPDHEFVQLFGVGHGFNCSITGSVTISSSGVPARFKSMPDSSLEQLVHGFYRRLLPGGRGERTVLR